jgi:hypothetical protein
MRGTDRGTYQRTAQALLRNNPKPKPFGSFDGVNFEVGTQSLHRTPASRMWRMFWRMKYIRSKS